MKLRCFVDERPIETTSLTRRQMNFGQGCPGLPAHAYRLEAETGELVAVMRGAFEQLSKELIDDLPYDADSEEVRSLQALGWPSLEALLRIDAGLLARVLSTYLLHEVLDTLLPHRVEDLVFPVYTVDSVSTLEIDPSTVRIEGIAYPISSW